MQEISLNQEDMDMVNQILTEFIIKEDSQEIDLMEEVLFTSKLKDTISMEISKIMKLTEMVSSDGLMEMSMMDK